MYSIGQFLCAIQTNRWAFAFCASLGPGFLVRTEGQKIDKRSEQSEGLLLFFQPAWQAFEREGKGSFRCERNARGARPSLFPRAQNSLYLPFQTLATQATLLQESGIDKVESGIQARLSGTLTWSEVTILV